MKKISKFDFMKFNGGYDEFAVSKQRYSRDEAIAVAKREMDIEPLVIGEAYVTHRAGMNEDDEPCVGWWIDYEPYKRSTPAWVFHGGTRRLDDRRGYVGVTE